VWFLEGNSRLSTRAYEAISAEGSELVIPTIVLAEIAFLYGRRRIGIGLPDVYNFINTSKCNIYPLDEAVIDCLPTALNIHDAIIVATALMFRDFLGEHAALVTKDTEIVESNLIDTIW
jgi:predicted nucleic acid-binding protein